MRDKQNSKINEVVLAAGVIEYNNRNNVNITKEFGGWKRDWIIQRMKIRHGDKANIIV